MYSVNSPVGGLNHTPGSQKNIDYFVIHTAEAKSIRVGTESQFGCIASSQPSLAALVHRLVGRMLSLLPGCYPT